nr:MAG TPA: hypothetical protein [Caudoviricetes sp.]
MLISKPLAKRLSLTSYKEALEPKGCLSSLVIAPTTPLTTNP